MEPTDSADELDLLPGATGQRGHYVLESGMHTDLWLDLDGLFLEPRRIAPAIATLTKLIEPYGVTAVCGPLVGGGILAHAIATLLGVKLFVTERQPDRPGSGLFQAVYQLPAGLRWHAKGERFAIVDDVISAGSASRATAHALDEQDAEVAVVGTLLLLGRSSEVHFAPRGVPMVSVTSKAFNLWEPSDCPLCRSKLPIERRQTTHAGRPTPPRADDDAETPGS